MQPFGRPSVKTGTALPLNSLSLPADVRFGFSLCENVLIW